MAEYKQRNFVWTTNVESIQCTAAILAIFLFVPCVLIFNLKPKIAIPKKNSRINTIGGHSFENCFFLLPNIIFFQYLSSISTCLLEFTNFNSIFSSFRITMKNFWVKIVCLYGYIYQHYFSTLRLLLKVSSYHRLKWISFLRFFYVPPWILHLERILGTLIRSVFVIG